MYQRRRTVISICLTCLLLAVFVPMIAVGAASADSLSPTDLTTAVTQNDSVTTAETTTGSDLFASAPLESQMASQGAGPSIALTQDLSLVPEDPGTYEVTHEYSLPDNARLLEFTLPDGASVNAVDGFIQQDERTYEWDRDTADPTVTYQLSANRSADGEGPIDAAGRYLFVDVGDWALVSKPRVSHQWGWQGERVGFNTEMTTDEGITSDVIAYLGEYDKNIHEAHDQEFTLVIPEAASLTEDPDDLFDSVGAASDSLRVGERDESVFMIAAPTGTVEWGVRGLQTGPADLWVRDFERLDEPANVWLHEYVHTRQGYTSATDFRWFTEATATYYAALLTYEQDRIEFADLAGALSLGERQRFSQSVLTDPQSWASAADYRLGSLVTGAIDKEIREDTAGEESFEAVFRQANAHEGVVTAADFREIVRQTASEEVATQTETYTGTTDHPVMWDETTHAAVFDQVPPASITFALADDVMEPAISGPYREGGVGTVRPITMVPNETIAFGITAENFGGLAGEYNTSLFVNEEPLRQVSGTLEPQASELLEFNHTVRETGEKRFTLGDVTLPVSVVEPAEAAVTSFTADKMEVSPGESVTLTVTVENDAAYPGERTLSLTQNTDPLAEETVRLDGESMSTVSFNATVSESGTTVFSLGDVPIEPVIVTVDDSETETDAAAPNDESNESATPGDEEGSGFGLGVALLTLLLVSLLLVTRRESSVDAW